MVFWRNRSWPSPTGPRRNLLPRRWLPRVEELETRTLLSGSDLLSEDLILSPSATRTLFGYTPAQVRQAYGFDQVAFPDGVRADGSGQTIAIVTAYDHPWLENDLRMFNRAFNLPEARLTRVNQFGGSARPRYDPQWALETALDVQWAHAIAPGADILLVQANSARLGDLMTAVDYARQQPGVVAVSMSWGTSEFARQGLYNGYFTTPAGHVDGAGLPGGVTFVAASGDTGTPSWPATSANVLAVGGSRLDLRGGTYVGEVGWAGSGGGLSRYEAAPDYQAGLGVGPGRAVPDVSYGADPSTGFAVFATLPGLGAGWFTVGGTSAGAPQWAALIAIAAQGRNLQGLPALEGAQEALYELPGAAFRDILAGANGHLAGEGYDLVTGLGSPRAGAVIAGLIGAIVGGAPVGPSFGGVVTPVTPPATEPPPDADNLVLILQTLSELTSPAGTGGGIPVTPGRLPDVPPPRTEPIRAVPPPVPTAAMIRRLEVPPDMEMLEPKAPDAPPPPASPSPSPVEMRPDAAGGVPRAERADEQAERQGTAQGNVAAAAPALAPLEAGNPLFRWVAATGLGVLLCALWAGHWTRQRRERAASAPV